MLAVVAGRMVRWLILSLLVLKLGPGAVDLVAHHALRVVAIVGVLAVLGFAWWWMKKKALRQAAGGLACSFPDAHAKTAPRCPILATSFRPPCADRSHPTMHKPPIGKNARQNARNGRSLRFPAVTRNELLARQRRLRGNRIQAPQQRRNTEGHAQNDRRRSQIVPVERNRRRNRQASSPASVCGYMTACRPYRVIRNHKERRRPQQSCRRHAHNRWCARSAESGPAPSPSHTRPTWAGTSAQLKA